MSLNHLTEQEQIRRNSLEEIRKLGIDPYPPEGYEINTSSKDILENYDPDKENLQDVSLAGRIMSRRIMGNASFIEIQDSAGKIQAYFRRDTICPDEDKTQYNTLFKKLLDIGDIIGVKGNIFKTQVGEISVNVKEFTLLSKSIRPLPIVKEKDDKTYDAFTDPEQRYRNRSMDLVVNPHIKDTFIKRTKIIQSIRTFLNNKEYLEVETPVLQPIYGGAAARPFKTHHNTLNQTLYLRIADELYLKRIIIGGFDGVYEFAKDFRNEGMDRYHNPEFTMMEIYVAYKDYNWMMDLFEEMIEKVTLDLHSTTKIQVGEKRIDFKRPWKRLTMFEAIKEYAGVDISKMDEKELYKEAGKLGVEVNDTMGKGKLIDEIFGETTEPKLIQPTYITDYPVEMSPLSKKHRTKKGLVERFEAIVNGKELCNAFSELNDPIEQRKRFEHQLQLGKKGDEEAMITDEAFLKAVELGMPPMAGLGVGIDRLTMLMTDSNSIQDVIFFPQMRPEERKKEKDKSKKEDYIDLNATLKKELPMDYKNIIEYLKDKLDIPNNEIFNFFGTPGEKKFHQNFNFCQEALLKHINYGISPSLYYFRNNNNINARAIKINNNYLIEINKGLIEFFDKFFVSCFNLSDFDELNKYLELEKNLTNPICELMYQSSTHFTFYHELGHLIQFVDKFEIELEESLNCESDFSIQQHSKELDADLFSSICVSTHIYQYFERYYQGKPTQEALTNYISILTSSIFLYFLSFNEYRDGFYLKEKSHPHPLVRIISAITRIIDYFEHVLNEKGLGIKINQQSVIKETFRVSEIFIKKLFNESYYQDFLIILVENKKEIMEYYDELKTIVIENPSSAINRRNEIIKLEQNTLFSTLGVPEKWVEVLKQLGYTTIEKLKEVEKPGKLANDLNGYNKKNKLGLKGLSPEEVGSWLSD